MKRDEALLIGKRISQAIQNQCREIEFILEYSDLTDEDIEEIHNDADTISDLATDIKDNIG